MTAGLAKVNAMTPLRRGLDELDEYIRFYTPQDIEKLESETYNYEPHKKAALAVWSSSLKSDRCFLLLFGVPGSGKSEFTKSFARNLNEGNQEKTSLLEVQCDELSTSTRSAKEIIDRLDHKSETALKNLPALILFDEIDSLTSSIDNAGLHAAMLSRWVRTFVRRSPSKALIIGTTNNPRKIDFSIVRRIRASIFFDVAPPEVVTKIIKTQSGRDDFEDVSRELFTRLETNDFVPIASDVVKACEEIHTRYGDLKNISKDDFCRHLEALTPGLENRIIQNFKEKNYNLVVRAEKQMKYWEEEFELQQQKMQTEN